MSDLHSLLGPYVTDSLGDDERDAFELHLESCDACRREVVELRETMTEVSALQESAPPPGLRSSILTAISESPMLPVDGRDADEEASDAGAPHNVVTADFARPRRPVITWLAAAAAVLAVALGGVTVWQQSELRSLQAAQAQRAELLTATDLQVSPARLDDGAGLTYLVSQSRGEAIIATADFPSPGTGRSWQVWVVQDEVPRSVAIIDEGGQLQVPVEGVMGGDVMAITNEPRGGSPEPTGNIQAAVDLQSA